MRNGKFGALKANPGAGVGRLEVIQVGDFLGTVNKGGFRHDQK
jgi:hypothetical protein